MLHDVRARPAPTSMTVQQDLLSEASWPRPRRQPSQSRDRQQLPARTGRALLLEDIHPDATQVLRDAGFEVEHIRVALHGHELATALRGVELLGIRSATQVTRRVLEAGGDLRAIGAFCIGTNQIDVRAATDHGVAVFNAPYSNTRSVVELALAELIALTRQLPARNAALHAGVWDKTASGSHEIRQRRLGIVGYGNIGSQLSVLAEALGMTVLFHDVADRLPLGNARRCHSLHELLEQADAVTVHVDGRTENAGMIGETELAVMKPGSVLLNLSRGNVVDLSALRRHLDSGHLAGAAIDVFPQEPRSRGDRFTHPLQGVPNVILTPHIGGSTQEAQQDIGQYVAHKLSDYAQHATTASSVNLPPVTLARTPATCRIQLLHRPAPDGPDHIAGVLHANDIDVAATASASTATICQALIDVPVAQSTEAVAVLSEVPGAVRVEVRP